MFPHELKSVLNSEESFHEMKTIIGMTLDFADLDTALPVELCMTHFPAILGNASYKDKGHVKGKYIMHKLRTRKYISYLGKIPKCV